MAKKFAVEQVVELFESAKWFEVVPKKNVAAYRAALTKSLEEKKRKLSPADVAMVLPGLCFDAECVDEEGVHAEMVRELAEHSHGLFPLKEVAENWSDDLIEVRIKAGSGEVRKSWPYESDYLHNDFFVLVATAVAQCDPRLGLYSVLTGGQDGYLAVASTQSVEAAKKSGLLPRRDFARIEPDEEAGGGESKKLQGIDPAPVLRALERNGYFECLPGRYHEQIERQLTEAATKRQDPRLGLMIVKAIASSTEEDEYRSTPESVARWMKELLGWMDGPTDVRITKIGEQPAGIIGGKEFEGSLQASGLVDASPNENLLQSLFTVESLGSAFAQAQEKYVGIVPIFAEHQFGFCLDPVGDGDLDLLGSLDKCETVEDRWRMMAEWDFIYSQ